MIAIGVFVVVLLVVIISALAKKKKINRHNRSDANGRERRPNGGGSHEGQSQTPCINQGVTNRNNGNSESYELRQTVYSSLVYYIYMDGATFGPFSLEQLKTFPLLENTLITTNTLNNTWYEAKYFECLEDLFKQDLPFRIDADGVIIREG